MKIKTLLIGLVGFFLLMSCEKEPPRLPDETQEGLGTFGCLVNGELVIPRWRSQWGPGNGLWIDAYYDPTIKQFSLVTRTQGEHWFEFYVSNPKIGQCVIDSVFFSSTTNHYYVARSVPHINLTRFDGNIASGTFAFDADYYENGILVPDKKIQVRKGRFDVHINTY